MQSEAVGDVLAASGALGCIFILFFGTLLLALLPVWAIIDCAISNKTSESKTIWIVLIFFTWGIGSLIYATFFADSRFLRITGAVSILGSIVVTVLTITSIIAGVTMSNSARQERFKMEHVNRPAAIRSEPDGTELSLPASSPTPQRESVLELHPE